MSGRFPVKDLVGLAVPALAHTLGAQGTCDLGGFGAPGFSEHGQ